MLGRVLLIILFMKAGVALAGDAATQPTVASGAGPADAFAAFVTALSQGRDDAVESLCIADDSDARAVQTDLKLVASAIGVLRKSVASKFGPAAADMVLPIMLPLDHLDEIQETINGDHATVSGPGMMDAPMVTSGGQWKLDIGVLVREQAFGTQPHGYFSQLIRVIRQTAADVDGNRLPDAESARDALQARQESIKEDDPTTAPSTEPSPTTTP